jgi:Type II secretory pathway, pseudopilin PulG
MRFPASVAQARQKTRGFTFLELLGVIVVIRILAAIAVPILTSQADKASDTALKSDLTNAAKLLQVAEANGETLPTEFTAGEVEDLGTAGSFTASETLTVTGSGETLCVEGVSDSGNVYSADVTTGLKNRDCSGWSPIQATGGDKVYTITVHDGGYRVHQFPTVGESTFTVTDAGATGEVEYLILAGGGGGGGAYSSITLSGSGAGWCSSSEHGSIGWRPNY